jgi:glutamine amidotransferase
MLARVGQQAELFKTPQEAKESARFILPGVGSWDEGVIRLKESGWSEFLSRKVIGEGRPFLGICLGMQLLFETSEEGTLPGLGWLEGRVVRFDFSTSSAPTPRIPHMGWRSVRPLIRGSGIFAELEEDPRFYFVHSYYCECADRADRAAEAEHGVVFTCAVRRGPVYGVQFHPEKSHRYGMRLLHNFARLSR